MTTTFPSNWLHEHWGIAQQHLREKRICSEHDIHVHRALNVFGIDLGFVDEAMGRNLHIPLDAQSIWSISSIHVINDGSWMIILKSKDDEWRTGLFSKPAAIQNLLISRLSRYNLGNFLDKKEFPLTPEACKPLADHFGKDVGACWMVVEDLYWILGWPTGL